MQYALALMGAALASVATAVPHEHGHAHAHMHKAREAEAQEVHTVFTTAQPAVVTNVVTLGADGQPQVGAQAWGGQQGHATTFATQATQAAQSSSSTTSAVQWTATSAATSQATSQAAASSTKKHTSQQAGTSTKSSSSPASTGSDSSPMVHITNNCDKTIYIGLGNDAMKPLKAGASPFTAAISGSAIAWKLGFEENASWDGNNSEIELTVDGSTLWYDLSDIKGSPFQQYGQKLTLGDSSCKSLECSPGAESCQGIYNTEADNPVSGLSLSCGMTSVYYTACSG